MYQYKHASAGLKPKQVTTITPTCPMCGRLMWNGRQRVVATERRMNRGREYVHSYKSFEICADHDMADASAWFAPLGLQLGFIARPQLADALS